jgi:RNA-directed DNA polymerase
MAKAKSTSRRGSKKTEQKSVLSMTAKQARAFFLKPESYCRVELPSYFDFGRVLRPVTKLLQSKTLSSASSKVRDHDGVNYTIYSNKDGRYAWRPFQLIHPAIYVDLTNRITETVAWSHIVARFSDFAKDPKIRCLSIPRASLTKQKDQATQVQTWWQGIEQASIEMALDYNHVYHADITDCYGSIYTHSVAWALHTRPTAKAQKTDKSLIGNLIDWQLQDMQQGQTNGIPQGSVLVDLIAEIVLGYADLELSEKLKLFQVADFQILRYRDDYRIFVNSPQVGEQILKALTEVLLVLGLKLNSAKTTTAQAVISSSIKADKKQWMRSRPRDRNLQKHLLLIHFHSTDFPNAGSLLTALDGFYQRIIVTKAARDITQLISVAVDIGLNSPRCFPVCAAVISRLVGLLATKKEKIAALSRVRGKLSQLPNNGHLEVWQQRLSYHFDPKVQYAESLCKLVEGAGADLWSNKWITDKTLRAALDPKMIVNRRALKSLKPVLRRAEFSLFSSYG